MSNTHTYTNGNLVTSGNVGISAQNITIDATYGTPVSASDELPEITMNSTDEYGRHVTLTMKPEANISTGDLTKIFMLSLTMIGGRGHTVNALSYVKKHNLERHFTYS